MEIVTKWGFTIIWIEKISGNLRNFEKLRPEVPTTNNTVRTN